MVVCIHAKVKLIPVFECFIDPEVHLYALLYFYPTSTVFRMCDIVTKLHLKIFYNSFCLFLCDSSIFCCKLKYILSLAHRYAFVFLCHRSSAQLSASQSNSYR